MIGMCIVEYVSKKTSLRLLEQIQQIYIVLYNSKVSKTILLNSIVKIIMLYTTFLENLSQKHLKVLK